MKHLYRCIEKAHFSREHPNSADYVLDIVRCSLVCDTKDAMAAAFKAVVSGDGIKVLRVKHRWKEPTVGGWASARQTWSGCPFAPT